MLQLNFSKMSFRFVNIIPNNITLKPVLISGVESSEFTNQIYLALETNNTIYAIYQIKHSVHCSPFKQAMLVDNLLAVGYEECFYLYNIDVNRNLLRLEMEGYFGHLYYNTDRFYVSDASQLHCIEKDGTICWKNSQLAIDGIIINDFTDTQILGSGEFDPPGGWVDFSLDKSTGIKT